MLNDGKYRGVRVVLTNFGHVHRGDFCHHGGECQGGVRVKTTGRGVVAYFGVGGGGGWG